jgi:hypothetical protein
MKYGVRTVGNIEVLGDPGVGVMCGDVDVLGPLLRSMPRFPERGEIGWAWDRERQELCAQLRTQHATIRVRVPLRRVRAAVNAALREIEAQPMPADTPPTVEGIFSGIKRAMRSAGRAVTSPISQVSRGVQRRLLPIVRKAAGSALEVARSKPFAAAMGAMAVAPPLTAVGAAGLAAHQAANTAKHVLAATQQVRRGLPAVTRAAQAAQRNPQAALALASRYARSIPAVPDRGPGGMLKAALKSIPF